MRVIHRILDHSRGERPPPPICLLRTLAEFHAKVPLHQSSQAKFADPKQARGNHRVENPARGKV